MADHGARMDRTRRQALDRLEAACVSDSVFPRAALALDPGEGGSWQGEEDLAAALAEGRRRDMAAGRTLTGPHRADLTARYVAKRMEAKYCSTGEQKALLISVVLANARALAQDFGAAPILLLDEVAAHLDADRRAALYDEIAALGAQAWMTGTGRELFEPLEGRARFLRVDETDGVSVVTEEET